MANYADSSTYSTASGRDGLQYVVLQVTLKEKFLGTGSGNLSALEEVLNEQRATACILLRRLRRRAVDF